jgi:hypothetical protein
MTHVEGEFGDEETLPPNLVAEADLVVWRQGVCDPHNPVEVRIDHETEDLDFHRGSESSPRTAKPRSSRAVERIRAVKSAIKNQLHPESVQRYLSPSDHPQLHRDGMLFNNADVDDHQRTRQRRC